MNILVLKISIYVIIAICHIKENRLIVSKAPRMAFICQIRAFMAVAQWRQMRQMPHFWNGKCNLLKANKKIFFQNLSIHPLCLTLFRPGLRPRHYNVRCQYKRYNRWGAKFAKALYKSKTADKKTVTIIL
jgi:hypothetical protein